MAINNISGSAFTTGMLIADTVHDINGGSVDSLEQFTKVDGVIVDAALEIQSTSGALLIPRMTTAQRDALVSTNAMMLYNTDLEVFNFFVDDEWVNISQGDGDVVGPDTSVDGNIATFNGTTGGVIKDSGVNIDQVPPLDDFKSLFSDADEDVNEIRELGHIAFGPYGLIDVNDNIGIMSFNHDPGTMTQQVVITDNTSGLTPSSTSAMLDIRSTKGSLVIARMTTTQVNALVSPPNGMLVYDLTLNLFKFRQAGSWFTLINNSSASYILKTPDAGLTNSQALSLLSTGILKSTTATGVVSTAVNGTDYYSPGHPITIRAPGTNNLFMGNVSGNLTLSGSHNLGIGDSSLLNISTGNDNVALGTESSESLTTGSACIAIGRRALQDNDVGSNAIAIGDFAMQSINGVSFIDSVAIGNHAFQAATGFGNITIGTFTLSGNDFDDLVNASHNVCIGYAVAGEISSSTTENVFIGYQCAISAAGPGSSIGIGSEALSVTDGNRNIAIGHHSMQDDVSSADNVFIGYQSGLNTNGNSGCTFVGSQTFDAAVTGVASNTGFGYKVLSGLTTGPYNASFGANSMLSAITADRNSVFGDSAFTNFLTGSYNTVLGFGASANVVGGSNHTIVGALAAQHLASVNDVVAIGYRSLIVATAPDFSVAIGTNSCSSTTTGDSLTMIGYNSYASGTGNSSVGVGDNVLQFATGNFNTAVGSLAMSSNSGSDCTGFGYRALQIGSADFNTAVGSLCMYNLTSGEQNSSFGAFCAENLDTGINNCLFGYYAGNLMESASSCVAIGESALSSNVTGSDNTCVGTASLQNATAGQNTAIGSRCMATNVGANGTAVGYGALNNGSGDFNCAFGAGSLQSLTTGTRNLAAGYFSGQTTSAGNDNVFLGYESGIANILGSSNVLVGSHTGTNGTALNNCVSIGNNSLDAATTATSTTCVGSNAGGAFNNYGTCTFIGASTDATVNSLVNATAIGYGASVSASNSLVLGFNANVGIGTSAPQSELHVVGTIQQKGVPSGSGYTGTDIYRGQSAVQSIFGGLWAVLFAIEIPTTVHGAAGSSILVTLNALAQSSAGGGKSAYSGLNGQGAYYDSGFFSISTLNTPAVINNGLASATAQWAIVGSQLQFQVATTLEAAPVNWVCSYEYFVVGTLTT